MKQELAELYAKNQRINNQWFDFVKQFDGDVREIGYLQGATFELTAFCTLKCPMCYVRIDPEQARVLGGKPLTADQWIELARQYRDQGGLFLLITGGEAMMRPDFDEIYTEISKMGLLVTLFTNGTTIDDRMLELLKKRPPSMVGLTIYGACEDTYRKFGGSEGSFKRALDGLDRLLTIPNLALDVRLTVCSSNYKDVREVFDLVAKRNKLLSVDFGSCAPVRGATSRARDLRLSKEQVEEVNQVIKEMIEPVQIELQKLYDKAVDDSATKEECEIAAVNQTGDRKMWCKGGKNGVYIAWDGRMYPCDMASYPYSFPLEVGFKNAVDEIRQQVDSLLLPERCLTCANKNSICSCIPKAQNEMKDCAASGIRCNYIPL